MSQDELLAAFKDFAFRVGQEVQSRHAGFRPGFVIARALVQDDGGLSREYLVRHSPDSQHTYFEFELKERP